MDSGVEMMNGTGVGALLKASRVRRGEELEDIAQQLRIRYSYLQALEEGRSKELPGQTYAVGFVRAYADHLGLDSNEVVRRFKTEAGKAAPTSELIFPTPVVEGGIPSGAVMLVGVVVAFFAYGGWYLSTIKEGLFEQYVEPLPARLIALLPPELLGSGSDEVSTAPAIQTASEATVRPQPSPSSATAAVPAPASVLQAPVIAPEAPVAPAELAAVPLPVSPAPVVPAPAVPAVTHVAPAPAMPPIAAVPTEPVRLAATLPPPAVPRPAEPAPAVPAVPPPPPATSALSAAAAPVIPAPPAAEVASVEPPAAAERTFGIENASSRILLKARNDSWVQIRDTLEKRFVMTRLLRTGDSYQVPDIPGLVLKTGNAGALEVFVDGSAVPALGAMGAVKSITLEPDKLVQGQAAAN